MEITFDPDIQADRQRVAAILNLDFPQGPTASSVTAPQTSPAPQAPPASPPGPNPNLNGAGPTADEVLALARTLPDANVLGPYMGQMGLQAISDATPEQLTQLQTTIKQLLGQV